MGQLESGKKVFAWGGLPGEKVEVTLTKSKSSMAEGVVTEVLTASKDRVEPKDPDSYLSTSPWQIMNFETEQKTKSDLIKEAFELHHIELDKSPEIYSDNATFEYRNKMEYSFWWDNETDTLDLAFFRRGTHGKIPIQKTSLASPSISIAAENLLELVRKNKVDGRSLKTLLIRSTANGAVAMQLYVKDMDFELFSDDDFKSLKVQGFEVIFSNPKSPASVITKRLQTFGDMTLQDSILGTSFNYAVEGFFQVNIPVYEQALKDMKIWIDPKLPTIDMYSGVGTIGLTIGSSPLTLVEINEYAVEEMKRNITELKKEGEAKALLLASENALEEIVKDCNLILDPPRAGLHDDVTYKILDEMPKRIVYLSCNPVTQARDIAKLLDKYRIEFVKGYNFFPRTPHIENLVVLTLK